MYTNNKIFEEQTEKPSIIGIFSSPGLQFERMKSKRMVDSRYFDAIKMGILRKEWEQV
ncbi:hypothetical protein ACPA2L_30185 [Bacillus bombysepticus]